MMYSRLTLKHFLLGSLLSSSVKGNMHAKEVREQLEIAGQNYGLEEEHDSLRKLSVPAELNVDFSMFQGSWYDCMHTTLMTFNGEPADKHIIEQVGCDYGNLGNITKVGNHTQTLMFDIHVLNDCWFHDLGGNGQKPCPNDRLGSHSGGDGNVLVKYSYKGIGSFAETDKIEFFTDHTSIKDEDGNWKINFNRAKLENTDTMVCQTHWKGIVCDWKINEYRTSTVEKLMETCTYKNGKCPKRKVNEKQCESKKWIWDVNAKCSNATMTTTVEDGFVYDSFGSYYLVKDTAQCDVPCGTEDLTSSTAVPSNMPSNVRPIAVPTTQPAPFNQCLENGASCGSDDECCSVNCSNGECGSNVPSNVPSNVSSNVPSDATSNVPSPYYETMAPTSVPTKKPFQGHQFDNKVDLQTAIGLWIDNNNSAVSKYGKIDDWDVSLITNMDWLFYNKQAFNADLSRWNVAAVTAMSLLFYDAKVFNADLSGWDVSSATSMFYMFYNAKQFNQVLCWKISSKARTDDMFTGSSGSLDLDPDCNVPSDATSNVPSETMAPTSVGHQFDNKSDLQTAIGLWIDDNNSAVSKYGKIDDWDVSLITNMYWLFYNKQAFNADLSRWNVAAVSNMSYMFYDAKVFNADLSGWDVSSATSMYNMFTNAKQFNQVLCWKISSKASTDYMFYGSSGSLDLDPNC